MYCAMLYRSRSLFEVSFELKDFDPKLIRILFGEETYQRIYGKEAMTPALTDEELAEVDRIHCTCAPECCITAKLIAAFHASRAEIERLRSFLDEDQLKRYQAEAYQEWRSQQ